MNPWILIGIALLALYLMMRTSKQEDFAMQCKACAQRVVQMGCRGLNIPNDMCNVGNINQIATIIEKSPYWPAYCSSFPNPDPKSPIKNPFSCSDDTLKVPANASMMQMRKAYQQRLFEEAKKKSMVAAPVAPAKSSECFSMCSI